ncbi:flagellar assembly protein FliW [Sulfurimonas hongkongensis]|uniref:Flagellar assembly factor FliW n=1 Tax=Sulfurimonas hongkongensis TaxID=1172190 RepID=T0JQ50_9BACT|nr:flagellar assembly protein FliW [Sulfurimonas hongkongensis]EQB40246.1 flagellar assembly protein FliW [Sulfurimonas hongkongensis]
MQKYKVKGSILGFEETMNVEIVQIDNLFSTIRDIDNKNISFTVVNPYELREYSFDIKSDIKILLDIKEDSSLSAYNIVVIQKPLENSTVNFLAPIVINNDNMTIAQAVLDPKKHPDFGMAESIKTFM